MRALSAAELLDVREQGQGQSLPQRALLLLAAACPDLSADRLGELPVGQRDARLLTLRQWTFGPQVVGQASCPRCRERVELTVAAADLYAPAREAGEVGTAAAPLSLSVGGYDVQFRLPNSQDLVAVAQTGDADAGRRLLLERCVLAVHGGDGDPPSGELPAGVVETLAAQMAQADPQADVLLELVCPSCAQSWPATFDITAFFWDEMEAWANRTLHEVHTLAQAYGWREPDILALSPWRRQYYLNLVSGV